MYKKILRYIVVALIALSLGVLIYHLNQPTGSATFGSTVDFSEGFGGERDFGGVGTSLISGLFGVGGNLILIAATTVAVVTLRKMFARQSQSIRFR